MMGPLMAASTQQIAAQGPSNLMKFVKCARAAPQHVQVITAELNETQTILVRVQDFLRGNRVANPSRMALLKLGHVIIVVSSCVVTFGEIEKILQGNCTQEMDILGRMRWAKKEDEVAGLISRLQNHKASLSLMLNILEGGSVAEARESVRRLATIVETYYHSMSAKVEKQEQGKMQQLNQRRTVFDDEKIVQDTGPFEQAFTVSIADDASQTAELIDINSAMVRGSNFTSYLQQSWVYKRNRAFQTHTPSSLAAKSPTSSQWPSAPATSIFPSTNSSSSSSSSSNDNPVSSLDRSTDSESTPPVSNTFRWSALTVLSISQVSNVSVINLPLNRDSLSSFLHSSHSWSNERIEFFPSLPRSLTRSTKPYTICSSICTTNPTLPGISGPPKLETFAEGKALPLAEGESSWYRCTSCAHILPSNALLHFPDGSTLCNSCTYMCHSCGISIKSTVYIIHDTTLCGDCFRCRNCKRRIRGNQFARTGRGFWCLTCYDLRRKRRERKRMEELAKVMEEGQGKKALRRKLVSGLVRATKARS